MAFLTKRLQAAITAFRSPRAVKSAVWGEGGWWGNGYAGTTSRNHDITFTEQGAATAYQIIVEVQRGVMFIADSIAMLPAGIYDSKTDKLLLKMDAREFDLYTPGATFLSAVRAYERQWKHNFIERIIFSDWLYGETFVVRLSNDFGGVTGLRWLNPLYTEPMELRGHIDYYQYTGDDGYYRINPSGMAFRIHHANPRDDLRGISPVLSALPSMNIERNAERGIMAYFRNGMVLGGVMMPEGQDTHLLEPEINKIQQDLRQHHTGVDQSHRWLVPPVRMTFETFNQPDLEKNYAVVKDASKKIMMALGVPPELAGNPDSVSYDNADKIMRNWLLVNGKAYANKLAGYINTSLLPYFEPRQPVYFKFDFTQIDRQDAALVQADFTSGIITINEALIQRGYKENPLLAGIRLIGGKPISDEVMQQLANDPAAFGAVTPTPLLLQTPGIGYQPNQLTIPGQVSAPALPEPAEQPEPQKGANSLCIMLTFANNPDLMTKLAELKRQYPDPAIHWTDPADLHVTLLIAPSVDDEQLGALPEAMAGYSIDGLSLPVGSLACFDTGTGQHALHYGIRRKVDFLNMQADIYDTCKELGLQMTSTSKPGEGYIPHITVAYLPEHMTKIKFTGRLNIEPTDLVCSVERGGEYEIIWSANAPEVEAAAVEDEVTEKAKRASGQFEVIEAPLPAPLGSAFDGINQHGDEPDLPESHISSPVVIDHDDHTHELPVITWNWSKDKARDELKTWQRFAQRGKHQRPFAFEYLRGKYADELTALVEQGNAPADVVKAITEQLGVSGIEWMRPAFDAALRALADDDHDAVIKSIDSIRGDFESRFGAVVADMQSGDLSSRQRAGNIIRQLLRMFGARAYRQGLEDAGVDDTPDEEEQAEINSLLSEQSGFVSSLTTAMINEGISQAQADGKAQLWFNGGISPLYSAGLMAGNKNIMLEFVLGGAEQHCTDCPRLNKQVHRAKDWKKRNLDGIPRVGQATECEGWRCQCKLVPTTAKASGSW